MQEIVIDPSGATDDQKRAIGYSALAAIKKMLSTEEGRKAIEKKKENLK